MPIQMNRNSLVENADGSIDSRYPLGDKPSFTPLLAEDFSGGTLGANYSNWGSASVFDNTRALSGSQSLKISTDATDDSTCGGSSYYGDRSDLPIDIPEGNRVWLSYHVYHPARFSWGYVYQNGVDDAQASACGKGADGSNNLKYMVMAPVTGTSRIYYMPENARRDVNLVDQVRIESEVSGVTSRVPWGLRLDAWTSIQMEVKVSSGADGYVRIWRDDVFLTQLDGATVVGSGNAIREWGMGNYWNGVPYTDLIGDSTREDFWLDEVIVATDVDGYGAPTTTDAGGRLYIAPTTRVGDFA